MTSNRGPAHIVVDGSNIATEGRSTPSLTQLNEAVTSFMEEYPDAAVTVVVDATFGHRIPKGESAEFDAGIANNELVAPPAGAVGRGDAFVLGIADKAGAAVLSNDSFQEFHGDYPWLFDEGRLIGGKPVPHVGWVWVNRVPVRGPVSRKATRGTSSGSRPGTTSGEGGRRTSGGRRRTKASKEASAPMPVPTSPPPAASTPKRAAADADAARRPAPKRGEPVNDLMPFLEFVERHPVGTAVTAVVDAYSSHGAYLTVVPSDDGGEASPVRVYVPLRFMADPPPRSAKRTMKIGERVDLIVVSFSPARRSVDCAVPTLADAIIAEQRDDDQPGDAVEDAAAAASGGDSDDRRRRRRPRKSTAKEPAAATKASTEEPPTKQAATKKTAKKAVAKKAATEKAAKKAVAKKAATKKTAAKKAVAKKAAAKKAVAKKAATEKAAKKAVAKKAAAKKAVAKKAAARKTAAKKTAAKKTAAKQTAAKRRSARTKDG